ncbi:heavy metal transport/detoxification superfamily protein [Striga asiatica]|uniref:Heavy metal transport/detoxification superfamily protein n=1 Tax=Striga asiatica TaxID=4170 RepID=A0A5A7R1Q8_STRAF|nr:heavy metal transport/detoxification superfamily protein [Striga asiatica]
MADKETVMVLKVDLQCPCCYKKVKKILCKFPQIRDQVYDEKANTVTITVFCCNPEKIRDKLCCKGAKVIKSIEIKDPPKPKLPEKPKDPVKPKEPEKPKVVIIEKPKELEKPKVVMPEKPKEPEKPKQVENPQEKPKEVEKPKEGPKPERPKIIPQAAPNFPQPEPVVGPSWPEPVNEYPAAYPVRTCCGECYGGYGGGPCYNGYGNDDYYGYDGYGYGRGCPIRRCDYYFSDENPRGCSIM